MIVGGRQLSRAESRVETVGSIGVHRRHPMAGAIERRTAARVSESLRHSGQWHPVGQHRRRYEMPQIVEPNMFQT
jgi:hypothetical protein